jgi:hypothetical protein
MATTVITGFRVSGFLRRMSGLFGLHPGGVGTAATIGFTMAIGAIALDTTAESTTATATWESGL